MLDSLETAKGMYLEDEGQLHYYAYSHEVVKEQLRVRAVKNISMKFNKKYNNQRKIEKIIFSDIILDYDNYITYDNKLEFTGRTKIEIEL